MKSGEKWVEEALRDAKKANPKLSQEDLDKGAIELRKAVEMHEEEKRTELMRKKWLMN